MVTKGSSGTLVLAYSSVDLLLHGDQALLSALLPLLTNALPRDQNEARPMTDAIGQPFCLRLSQKVKRTFRWFWACFSQLFLVKSLVKRFSWDETVAMKFSLRNNSYQDASIFIWTPLVHRKVCIIPHPHKMERQEAGEGRSQCFFSFFCG